MAISQDDLARMRTSINAFLVDSGVNSRTGATVPCWVQADTRELNLQGLPRAVRLRRWRIVLPDNTDVRPGDLWTIAGKGVYTTLEVASPTTLHVETFIYAAQQSRADGSWPILTNYTVTLRRRDQNGSIVGTTTIPVLIYSKQDDEKAAPPSGRCYAWTVCFPLTTLLNGTKVQAEDEIVWDQLRKGWAPLHRPEQHTEIIPYANANFEEVE